MVSAEILATQRAVLSHTALKVLAILFTPIGSSKLEHWLYKEESSFSSYLVSPYELAPYQSRWGRVFDKIMSRN